MSGKSDVERFNVSMISGQVTSKPINVGRQFTAEELEARDNQMREEGAKAERERVINLIQEKCTLEINHFISLFDHPDRYGRMKANYVIRDFCETLRKQCPHKELSKGGNICHSGDGCQYQLFGTDEDPTFCGEDEIKDLQKEKENKI